MKSLLLSIIAAGALATGALAADTSVTLNNVHMCCAHCAKDAQKAVASAKGASAVCDTTAHTVVITAPDATVAQQAVDALVKAGFYGQPSDASVKVNAETGAKGEKVQTLKVAEVHLCCPKCVKGVNAALKDVPGVTGNTAQKGATSFDVTGDFTDSDVMAALQKAGYTGTVAR